MQGFWEERYGRKEYIYGKAPNAFFRAFIDQNTPGRILLPAEGEGRNAVYAATKGWQVTAFDYSSNARAKAQLLAAENDVNVAYEVCGIREFYFGTEAYDAVGLFFVHQIPEDRLYLHQKALTCLKSGGRLVMEAFDISQLGNDTGGPKREDMLFTTHLLREDFPSLEMQILNQESIILEEGRFHSGPAEVVRMIGEKR